MGRLVLVGAVLVIAAAAILGQLRARGLPAKVALKTAIFGAGLVVSIKMTIGGYLALQAAGAERGVAETVGFYGAIALVGFFGWITLSSWRRATGA